MTGTLARALVALRWLLVIGWILGAAAAYHWLPSYSRAESGASQVVTVSTPAIRAERQSAKEFGFPLTNQSVLVQHEPDGLSPGAQARVVALAARIDAHTLRHQGALVAALPVLNSARIFPTSRHPGTTALTFLYFRPSASPAQVAASVHRLVRTSLAAPADHYIGATGLYSAEQDQGNLIAGSLSLVELAAIGMVLVVVAVGLRSLVAPLVALVAVAIAYVVSEHVLAFTALHLGFALPSELEPLIIILVVGVVTDYAVFFLSAQRALVRDGVPARRAAVLGTRGVLPLVVVAGVTVSAGTATLLVARLPLYHQLGPGMAISVAISLIVSVTFVPAAIALVGRRLFWPFPPRPAGRDPRPRRRRAMRLFMRRPVAALVLAVAVAALGAGVAQISSMRLGLNLVTDLPTGSSAARASAAVDQGFAPGIVNPAVVILHEPGIDGRSRELATLQRELSRQPGVAGVLGPADTDAIPGIGVFRAPAYHAARYAVILSARPLTASGVATLDAIRRHMPTLLRSAGLPHAKASYSGGTAIAADLSLETRHDVYRVGIAILAVDFVMLLLLLRSLVAPLLLLAASVLSVMSALGITVALFPTLETYGYTFYVPMAVGVLLLSFGSDYNIYLVGRIWESAGDRGLRDAIVSAVPAASTTITRAGVALALTFSLLAVVPLESFRSFGFAMAVGVLLDTFVVRSMIVPAVLRLVGRLAGFPNPRLMRSLAYGGR